MKRRSSERATRARVRLEHAREVGYLDATGRASESLVPVHSFWCWRLKTPLVWFERMSPRSRYGRVHLDLFPTPHILTERGEAELRAIAPGRVSPSDGLWEKVPVLELDAVAHVVFRAATRWGNYALRQREYSPEILKMMEMITRPEAMPRSA